MKTKSDSELIQDIKSENKEAAFSFSELWERHNKLYAQIANNLSYNITGHLRQDLMDDGKFVLGSAISSFDESKAKFSTWFANNAKWYCWKKIKEFAGGEHYYSPLPTHGEEGADEGSSNSPLDYQRSLYSKLEDGSYFPANYIDLEEHLLSKFSKRVQEMIKMRIAGLSFEEIGEKVDMHPVYCNKIFTEEVKKILTKHGGYATI